MRSPWPAVCPTNEEGWLHPCFELPHRVLGPVHMSSQIAYGSARSEIIGASELEFREYKELNSKGGDEEKENSNCRGQVTGN